MSQTVVEMHIYLHIHRQRHTHSSHDNLEDEEVEEVHMFLDFLFSLYEGSVCCFAVGCVSVDRWRLVCLL